MPSTDWTSRSLYDLARYINGRPFGSGEVRSPTGLPIIKIAELNRGINETTGRFDGPVDPRNQIVAGDLIFAWSGTIVVKKWPGPTAALNQHLFKVEANDGVDQDFLYCLLVSLVPTFERIVESKRTTMGHVRASDLKDLQVSLPGLPEQRRIASIVLGLDSRLTAITQTRASAEAYILSRLAQETTEPDERWNSLPVSSLARFVNGGAYTKGASGSGRMVLRIRELNSGPNPSTVYSDISVPPDQEASFGELLFSWSGSLNVYRWTRASAIVNQHIFKVIPTGYLAWFVWARLLDALPDFRAIARDKATTLGHIQRRHLDEAIAQVPPADVIERLDAELQPVWNLILATERETHSLEALRSLVLPQLVTGGLGLKDVGSLLEAAS